MLSISHKGVAEFTPQAAAISISDVQPDCRVVTSFSAYLVASLCSGLLRSWRRLLHSLALGSLALLGLRNLLLDGLLLLHLLLHLLTLLIGIYRDALRDELSMLHSSGDLVSELRWETCLPDIDTQ